ncbi:hypothetical protein EWB00_005859 [Schistosoma japonicum]|uniref:Uncharacterized protein n=1 Tax=Schistosoma japonicum TaxID=6182 RepID=A0A4Z2D0E8_SCHJA|nr:hypothetical protein EWB00_005859 [Schistosoma japonicum]
MLKLRQLTQGVMPKFAIRNNPYCLTDVRQMTTTIIETFLQQTMEELLVSKRGTEVEWTGLYQLFSDMTYSP